MALRSVAEETDVAISSMICTLPTLEGVRERARDQVGEGEPPFASQNCASKLNDIAAAALPSGSRLNSRSDTTFTDTDSTRRSLALVKQCGDHGLAAVELAAAVHVHQYSSNSS